MTLDKSIDCLNTIGEYYSRDFDFYQDEYEPLRNTELKSIYKAIDTMRKYQKIEKIVKFGNANELGFEYVGEKITEVLELE